MIGRIVRLLNFLAALPFAFNPAASVAMPHAPEDPWQAAQSANTAASYTRFIMQNPESPFANEAAARIANLAGAKPMFVPYTAHDRFVDDETAERFGQTRLMNI